MEKDEKTEIISAIVDLGQSLRGEIRASEERLRTETRELRGEVAEIRVDLATFKAEVREDFAGVRRDIASLRRSIFEDLTKLEDRVRDLERWKREVAGD